MKYNLEFILYADPALETSCVQCSPSKMQTKNKGESESKASEQEGINKK